MPRHKTEQINTCERITRTVALAFGAIALAGIAGLSGKGAYDTHRLASEQFKKADAMSLEYTGAQWGNLIDKMSMFDSEAIKAQSDPLPDAPQEFKEDQQPTDPIEAYENAVHTANTTKMEATGLGLTSAWTGYAALVSTIAFAGAYREQQA